MTQRVSHEFSRRQILAAASIGLGLTLVGCARPRRRRPPLSSDPIWTGTDRDPGPWTEPSTRPEARVTPVPSDVPDVLPRTRWTRQAPTLALANRMGNITRITIHHDGMPPVAIRSQRDASDRIELIRRSHVNRGWADIGYHYVVDPQGRVWQARPRSLQGAHVKYNNENNLGILVLGNFMEQRPTTEALASLDAFVAANMQRFRVPVSRVHTHQELRPTACPGTYLQRHMESARAWGGSIAAKV